MANRVVVTGMGAITPLGNSVETFWEGLKKGKAATAPITIRCEQRQGKACL